MTDAQTILEVRNLTKAYGGKKALDSVSLSVKAGEFVALIGTNGAGKTTLLQVLAGLFAPDSGDVIVLGFDMKHQSAKALSKIGVVFQQPTLDLELSVQANLIYHADLHGLPRRVARERIAWALERFDLADRARERARVLSGGNRRRLELARTLLHRPSVLLMDEATVGLDPASRRDILGDIDSLTHSDGLGVFWTTHLVDEVARADRVIVLRLGRVLFDGTPSQLWKKGDGGDPTATLIRMMGDERIDEEAAQ
jgi:ABC-2 type transport system ATP-binding protein